MDVTIRRIAPGDGKLLADLRLRALADAPYAFGTTHAEASRQSGDDWAELARRRSEGNREAAFLAYLGGDPVGMVAGFVDDTSHSVDLISMWVAPEARRHGAARDVDPSRRRLGVLKPVTTSWRSGSPRSTTAPEPCTKRLASWPPPTSNSCGPIRP